MAKGGKEGGILGKVFRLGRGTQRRVRGDVSVYFISGRCYNRSVFDELTLPAGFVAKYIEWYGPQPHETLQHYARNMASAIDTSRPFVLVGYSFGAVVMQEMNRFLRPAKSVVISSFKSKDEIPTILKAAKISKSAEYIPK